MRRQREAMIRKGIDSKAKASLREAKERRNEAMEPHGLERLGCGVELQGSAEKATALTAMRGRAAAKKRRAAIRNGIALMRDGVAKKRRSML